MYETFEEEDLSLCGWLIALASVLYLCFMGGE